jgi:hypothetical protein
MTVEGGGQAVMQVSCCRKREKRGKTLEKKGGKGKRKGGGEKGWKELHWNLRWEWEIGRRRLVLHFSFMVRRN